MQIGVEVLMIESQHQDMFKIGGTAVSWRSNKQSCVASSSSRSYLLGKPVEEIEIFEDNQSAKPLIPSFMAEQSTLKSNTTLFEIKWRRTTSSWCTVDQKIVTANGWYCRNYRTVHLRRSTVIIKFYTYRP